jgi:hypothetical protein
MLKKKSYVKSESDGEHGLEELISWLARLDIISESCKMHYLRKPEDFLVELCHGMILPKLAVQTDVVSLPILVKIDVQSNLCATTNLGTPSLWPLLTGGRCLEVGLRCKDSY